MTIGGRARSGGGAGRFATLNDIAASSGGGPPRGRPQQRQPHTGDDDEDEEDEGEAENWYTGGERRYVPIPSSPDCDSRRILISSSLHSGLSVENPDRPGRGGGLAGGLGTVRDILRKAAEYAGTPEIAVTPLAKPFRSNQRRASTRTSWWRRAL